MTDFAQLAFPRLDAVETVDDDARRRGYAAGFAEGMSAGAEAAAERAAAESRAATASVDAERRRLADAASALARAAAELDARVAPVIAGTEAALAAAALDLATAVLGLELSDPTVAAVAAATRATGATDRVVRLVLNPSDAATLRQPAAAASAPLGLPAGIEIVADPSVAAGDAVAETSNGSVDATIAAALDRIAAALGVTR